MISLTEEKMVSLLCEAGLPAVMRFPDASLNRSEPKICVSVKKAELSPSGLGNYIGSSADNGTVTELYGAYARIVLLIYAYSPAVSGRMRCSELLDSAISALSSSGVHICSVCESEERYDEKSGMFRCELEASADKLFVLGTHDRVPEGGMADE